MNLSLPKVAICLTFHDGTIIECVNLLQLVSSYHEYLFILRGKNVTLIVKKRMAHIIDFQIIINYDFRTLDTCSHFRDLSGLHRAF